jgi:hypothetical protein
MIDQKRLKIAHELVKSVVPHPLWVGLDKGAKREMIKRKNTLVKGAHLGRKRRMGKNQQLESEEII